MHKSQLAACMVAIVHGEGEDPVTGMHSKQPFEQG